MTEPEERAAVIAAAQTWRRTPYHHRARVKGAGVDCAQILVAVYSEAGLIEPFDLPMYPPDFMLHRGEEIYRGIVSRYCRQIDAPGVGDIVLYRFGRCFSHGGIIIDWPGRIIHAHRPDGMVVESGGDEGRLAGRAREYWSPWK